MMAVIWVLLAMMAGVALFSHWVHASLQHAQARQDALNARIGAYNAMHTALFIRLTGQRSAYGVSVAGTSTEQDFMSMFKFDDIGEGIIDHNIASTTAFAFDEQVWQYGGVNFVAQDTAGLIGLTYFNHQRVVEHLVKQGRTHIRPQQLVDTYLDYRDPDSQRRFSGAEVFDYRLRERAEPLNGALRNPLQLRDVMHWDRVLQPLSNGELLYRLRVEGSAAVNVNSAPREVLEWVLDDQAMAQRLHEQRKSQPFNNVFIIEAQIKDEAVAVGILPSDGLRFWWWEKNSPSAWVHEFHYDSLRPGRAALTQDWMLRVDVPEELTSQTPKIATWPLLLEFPDYLGRRRAP